MGGRFINQSPKRVLTGQIEKLCVDGLGCKFLIDWCSWISILMVGRSLALSFGEAQSLKLIR